MDDVPPSAAQVIFDLPNPNPNPNPNPDPNQVIFDLPQPWDAVARVAPYVRPVTLTLTLTLTLTSP